MENNELKKVRIKNYTCYCFDDIIKLEDFYLDNILINQKHENQGSTNCLHGDEHISSVHAKRFHVHKIMCT